MNEKYFVFYGTEDGDCVSCEYRSLQELVNDLTGRSEYEKFGEPLRPLPEVCKSIEDFDYQYNTKILIIKGSVVVPKTKQIAVTWSED